MENNKNEILIWEAPELIETNFEETESGTTPAAFETSFAYITGS